ncbi:hypothetical protein FHK92_16090 [Pseudomonas brassicacearum subsp. neoaurantiaca]|uniref:Uncharacterized protein n=1 Tax=Pseudomonas brassicacearum subsp. neoaurantiaca TaxID=494916 RepID=A0A7V8RMR8_9PSED|nr:hypothetical protein [Pseudomonas brassicacearum subsp. neoaurantiaca]
MLTSNLALIWWSLNLLVYTQLHCGSELARDSGTTVNIDVECQSVIASKLAPTRGTAYSRHG